MNAFERWWRDNTDGRVQTPIMEKCFHGGYLSALQAVLRLVTAVAVGALLAMLMSGCHDRYRYPCQNPDNFYTEQCQKPKCQFTQQCPEYLVAPILEKQIEQSKPAPEASPQR